MESGSKELGGAVGDDDHVVFAADAEFTDDVDAGLVRKGHARSEDGFAAAHKVGMLVAIEADAVSETVSEIFVAGAKTGGSDDAACGVIDGAGKLAGTGGVESGVLGFAHGFVGVLNFFGGLAEDGGASHIGLVAVDGTAAINEYDVTFL